MQWNGARLVRGDALRERQPGLPPCHAIRPSPDHASGIRRLPTPEKQTPRDETVRGASIGNASGDRHASPPGHFRTAWVRQRSSDCRADHASAGLRPDGCGCIGTIWVYDPTPPGARLQVPRLNAWESPAAITQLIVNQGFLLTITSTRRFFARPAAVLLSAIGCAAPAPLALTRSRATPAATKLARICWARRSDRA